MYLTRSSLCEEAAPSHRKITARGYVPSRRQYLLSKLCEGMLLRQVIEAVKAWLSSLILKELYCIVDLFDQAHLT